MLPASMKDLVLFIAPLTDMFGIIFIFLVDTHVNDADFFFKIFLL